MASQLRICTQRLRTSCPESVPPELWVFRGGREKGWSRSGTCMGKAIETRESTMWGQSVRSAGRLVLAGRWKIQELDEKKKSLQATLEGLSFRGLSACDPLEDFNCVSDKIRFAIQKAHSGSSSVGGKESGYPGDRQTQEKTMTIIQREKMRIVVGGTGRFKDILENSLGKSAEWKEDSRIMVRFLAWASRWMVNEPSRVPKKQKIWRKILWLCVEWVQFEVPLGLLQDVVNIFKIQNRSYDWNIDLRVIIKWLLRFWLSPKLQDLGITDPNQFICTISEVLDQALFQRTN